MGIHGLMKLLSEEAPGAIKEIDFNSLTGRKVAIDASMAMYQFLVAVRAGGQGQQMNLTNAEGEVTSHIQGMFNRTIKMMESGIKPVYIFDGKPPQLKGDELAKRTAKRVKAEADLAAAKEQGASEDVDRFNRRLVKVGRSHNEDCKNLLRLMGIPVFDAPCEAEAQCAELAKKGKVYATATEDMDALTFRTPKLLRKLTYSQSGGKGKDGKVREKQPVIEIDCEKVLVEMKLTYEQFVDLCILCGCDYSSTIKGIGPKTGKSANRLSLCSVLFCSLPCARFFSLCFIDASLHLPFATTLPRQKSTLNQKTTTLHLVQRCPSSENTSASKVSSRPSRTARRSGRSPRTGKSAASAKRPRRRQRQKRPSARRRQRRLWSSNSRKASTRFLRAPRSFRLPMLLALQE